MLNHIPQEFKILICGPFNARLKINYTNLANQYDQFRRNIFQKLQQKNTEEITYYIERFIQDNQALNDWLNDNKSDKTQLLFDKPQGITHRDTAIFYAEVTKTILPDPVKFDEISDYLAIIPKIEKLTINFQENGIGTISSSINIKLTKPITLENNEYKNFMQKLRDSFILSKGLADILDQCDNDVFTSSLIASPAMVNKKKIIDIKELYPNEKEGLPLWGHVVSIFNIEYEGNLPFGDLTKNALIVSHPDGLIDMNSLSKGFIHIGWGMSLAVGVQQDELEKLESTLTQLQFYWRSAQVMNDIVMKYLEKFTELKKFALKNIKSSMREIEDLNVEGELFFSYHMDYLKMLSPLSHYLYQETAKAWRLNDMFHYYDEKKDALANLHQQGEARIKENIESKRNKMSDRLNVLLSILALLTLFSWAADSIGFLDATLSLLPNLKSFLIGGKFFVIIMTPILVIIIFLFFIRLTSAMDKLED